LKKSLGVPELETLLGHRFRNPELLKRALTHRSLAHENYLAQHLAEVESAETAQAETPSDPSADNEQLEFLGDAVIGFLVAEDLCHRYPDLREGPLTRFRAELVSRHHLGLVAARLKLGDYMLLGRGEERSGGRRNSALLANCIEAVVAALYLDGGIEATRTFVLREVVEPDAAGLHKKILRGASIGDYKSALQERLQAQRTGQPEYSVCAESGPDHRKRFLIEVSVAKDGVTTRPLARGVGTTKKKAEQEAARRAIIKLERMRSGAGTAGENAPATLAGTDPLAEIDSEVSEV
jgi:ribonuclease III